MAKQLLLNSKKFRAFIFIFFIFLLGYDSIGQKLFKVYHGQSGVTQVRDKDGNSIEDKNFKLKPGEIVTVEVINANPLFYNYSIKYNNFQAESSNTEILTLFQNLNLIFSTRASGSPSGFVPTQVVIDNIKLYKDAINTLVKDINRANEIIEDSDKPEDLNSAFAYIYNAGLKQAIDNIENLSKEPFHFNNDNLLQSLNTLSQVAGVDDVEKEAYKLLNQTLVEKVNQIKKQINRYTNSIWSQTFVVLDSTTKITLLISKIDKSNNRLIRDGNGPNAFELEICTVSPKYKRATLELVPVANIVFSKDVREFYIENGLIQNRLNPKSTFSTGVVLNINALNFGEVNEFSLGGGFGYKYDPRGQGLDNFYLSLMLSYKNFIRIGLGYGYAQFPSEELKGGYKAGSPLPSNIANINELIEYKEQPSGFLTISFTGLNLSRK
ncbi:MAG TPA: hypothetical protein VK169_14715 [Saprospiraceae bacterium]|nr:hypothetical protein [Saprospiraceae bacterium]